MSEGISQAVQVLILLALYWGLLSSSVGIWVCLCAAELLKFPDLSENADLGVC